MLNRTDFAFVVILALLCSAVISVLALAGVHLARALFSGF